MDHDSPFWPTYGMEAEKDLVERVNKRTIHVNFCDSCHHLWKAPAAAVRCVNCATPGSARSLVEYVSDVPVT